uniref:Uncharacterized protein n=1 Tax=Ditylum brightwellii TaxID=49249 RepID=A0A7S4RZD0_9STRA
MESTTDDQQHTVMFDSDNIQQTGGGTHDSSSRWQKATYDAKSIRQKITFSGRKFDVKTLPVDLYRVYETLKIRSGEEYALTNVFMIRTAIELHRAWHNTLLTAKILQQLKDKFQVRMTWELGVIKLKFHVEDGSHELQYKVPYDYDSEYQDLYMKIAVSNDEILNDVCLSLVLNLQHSLFIFFPCIGGLSRWSYDSSSGVDLSI